MAKDDLELGFRPYKLTVMVTAEVDRTVREWAEIANWPLSRTIFDLLVTGIRAYDHPLMLGLLEKGGSEDEP
jgi:hypothetical protein